MKAGKALTRRCQEVNGLCLLIDGVLQRDVDVTVLDELGPGAILGERALLEGGRRTATLRALTKCTVAVSAAENVNRAALEELAKTHRREEPADEQQT